MDRRTAIRTLAAATALPVIPSGELTGLLVARRSVECGHAPGRFRPVALTDHQLELVKVIADTILPPTESPGATDVGVHEFIDLIVSEWMDDVEQEVFTGGLAEIDDSARETHGVPFLGLTVDQQLAAVAALDSALHSDPTSEPEPSSEPDPRGQDTFFGWMKRLTLTGYFTSEAGAALVDYRIIPGTFEGCLSEGPAR